MQVSINQEAKTVYGWGRVAKVNAKSVIVTVDGQNHKVSRRQFEIMNGEQGDVNDVANRIHY